MNTRPVPPDEGGATPHWSRQRERSNRFTLRLMSGIATLLGRRVARCVLHPITLYFLLFGGVAARASAQYLERALGRPPRWRERYRHIHHFASTLLDRIYFLRGRDDLFETSVSGAEHFDAIHAQGRGVLLFGAHFGSFEAMRTLGQHHRNLRVAMVMYEDNARMVNEVLQAVAPDAAPHVIALGRLEAMLSLRDWLDAGGVAGLLADRALVQGSGARSQLHRLPFLGAPATFADGPFRLAALLGRPVVFMAGIYHGGARYELRVLPLADFSHDAPGVTKETRIAQAVASYAGIVEALCRESPYNWFNFFDFWADGTERTDPTPR